MEFTAEEMEDDDELLLAPRTNDGKGWRSAAAAAPTKALFSMCVAVSS